jgi:hypothetical protein
VCRHMLTVVGSQPARLAASGVIVVLASACLSSKSFVHLVFIYTEILSLSLDFFH